MFRKDMGQWLRSTIETISRAKSKGQQQET